MQAIFNFHNVGQGLFYSGHIKCDANAKRFNFVYDCGATNKTTRDRSPTLDTAIHCLSSYLDGEAIDLLVISHLHNDHTNGISELLSYRKVKVKNIFIPYFAFEERLVTLLENGLQLTEEQTKLILNPYSYLASSDSVENIFVLKHQQNDDGMNDNDNDFENIQKDKDNNQSENPIYNELTTDSQKNKVFVLKDNRAIKVECWRFAFYVDESKTAKLDGDFFTKAKTEIDKLKTETDFKTIKDILKELKELYGKVDLNETSLIMAHKCNDGLEMRYIYPHCHDDDHHPYWRYHCRHHSSFVHILTGDFDFTKGKLVSVKTHFGNFLDSGCRILQVPHHGSKENWNNGLINYKHSLCVIPFGLQNQYGHPSLEVKNDILSSHDACLYEITEHQSLMLGFVG